MTLHRLFADAIADELIEANPCALASGELPKKVNKDPTWRSRAVYSREEVEQLLSDERIPQPASRHLRSHLPARAPEGRARNR